MEASRARRHGKNNIRVHERAVYGRIERGDENEKQRNHLRNFPGFGLLLLWMRVI
jgi:hypothetical protein